MAVEALLIEKKRLAPARFAAVTTAMIIILIVGACLLPHSRYIRFTNAHEPVLHKEGWIYQRLHHDPTPVDVVFIGSSHTIWGIDAEQVEVSATETSGGPIHIANLAVIHPGRDMDYLIAREALENKHPHLLLIEVQADEPRASHIAFYRFADARDILAAPMIINTHYFYNLLRLPSRQVSLFYQTLAPALFGDSAEFDLTGYRGTHWHDTLAELGVRSPATVTTSQLQLEDELQHFKAYAASKIYLPQPLEPLEYRVSLIYLNQIIALANAKNVPIRFLYVPGWRQPTTPNFAPLYLEHAPIWIAPDIFKRTDVWRDVNHLNDNGRLALSKWVGRKIGDRWLDAKAAK
ncbi:MAG TPA: hypothetical protein VGU20_11170 [Stellaceae bacterium]|nr:hypothetical protein [Stellaceae bacterium]